MKTKFLLISTAILFSLSGCKKTADPITVVNNQKVQESGLHEAFNCEMKVAPKGGAVTESNGPNNKLWANGSVIKVNFSGGSAYVRSKIKQYARTWENDANITFNFVADNAAADIKIAVNNNNLAWSYIGTDSKLYSPSMNYGWFNDNTSDEEFRRTVTHEFGHALGLNHEQSHPDANIPWNTQAVYDYYMGAPNYWDKAKIDFNVLYVAPRAGLYYLAYDPLSIMHYPVPAKFTTNNVAIAPNNTRISVLDSSYVALAYPKN